VSKEGFRVLPKSIQRMVIEDDFFTAPITIKELAVSDILIVVRSPESFEEGKIFRFNNFKCISKAQEVELWMQK